MYLFWFLCNFLFIWIKFELLEAQDLLFSGRKYINFCEVLLPVYVHFRHVRKHQCFIVFEAIWLESTHGLHVLLSQLEWTRFKVNTTWSCTENKCQVYMKYWTITFYHYITIVTIFEIKKILNSAETSQCLAESLSYFWHFKLRTILFLLLQII